MTQADKMDRFMSEYIHISKYSRWRERLNRRETWAETVDRYVEFWETKLPTLPKFIENPSELQSIYNFLPTLRQSIFEMKTMPSMRALMTAGKALQRDEIAGYNCTAIAVNNIAVFSEAFYLLMNGTGFGFSVERQYVNQLPEVAEEIYPTDTVLVVRDSKIGWATALKELISMLYNGTIPKWDTSKVRPTGSRLKTFGGRASGPEPLEKLFRQIVKVITGAKGRKLNSIECHTILCHIANTVIVGSVRRSALISLSNLTDDRMRRCKTGSWWTVEPDLALSNNSVAYTEKPDMAAFLNEWQSLYHSKSGERGIWNKVGMKKKYIANGRPEYEGDLLPNPCGEIALRDSGQACNLTEIIARPNDTLEILVEKAINATILGTLQATLTNLRFLRKIWQKNMEEERLLGVSITGIMDHQVLSGQIEDCSEWSGNPELNTLEKVLTYLRQVCRDTNKIWAEKLGITVTGHVTCCKPSGTVSLLTGTSSGIHPRYSRYYIRRVRQDEKDPLTQVMIDAGIPYIKDGTKYIFTFYLKSPEHSVLQDDIGAIKQLNLWKKYATCWADGNPSQTIYYTNGEFLDIAAWVWKNWNDVGGLSFFPKDDNVYDNPPLESITETQYNAGIDAFPTSIDWSQLANYEVADNTTGSQEIACQGGACELA
jgi:ribonucleoside-triphosphate reductase (thioredoxin)